MSDHRNIQLMHNDASGTSAVAEWSDGSDTWGAETGPTAYWELQKISDYFKDNHGFLGTKEPPSSYEIPSQIRINQSTSSFEWRTGYSYNSTLFYDIFRLGPDITGTSLPQTAAFMDVMAHEYTHALILHRTNFDQYGEAGAIMEGLCDYFGTQVSYAVYPSLYTNDWSNGFGWQTGEFARKFVDPTTDFPSSSSAAYGDPYWASGNRYQRSGVLRHQIVLHGWGGTFNGISVDAMAPTERDIFVTMMWWSWSNMNYMDFRNAMLGWYKMKYGVCSPKWISCVRSWAAVGVGIVPYCARTYREFYPVVPSSHTLDNSNINIVNSPHPGGGHVRVHTVEQQDEQNVAYYTWDIPQQWYTTWVDPQRQSAFYIDSVSGYDTTRQFRCIVTFADSTKDTLSGYVHFVDENYETIQQKGPGNDPISDINANISGNISVFPNPARDEITVQLPFTPRRFVVARLFDMMGREVMKKDLILQHSILQLPELPAGTYILKVKGEGADFVSRVAIKR